MKEHTRSAPETQGGVDAERVSEQEIFATALYASYSEDTERAITKKFIRNIHRRSRIDLARSVSKGRQSRKFPENAANVLKSLLGASEGDI